MDLKNSHLVVLGSGKRLGLLLTERFLAAGARVSGFHRSPSSSLEGLLEAFPKSLKLFQFDLEDWQKIPEAAGECVKVQGPISGVVCVASQFYPTPLGTVSLEQWDNLFNTNVKGHFFFVQALIPYLTPSSHLLTLVDIFAQKPLRNYLPYSSAKGALLTMTRNLAQELAPKTRVNSISPGPVLMPEFFSKAQEEQQIKNTLLGRLGSPQDIWEATSFLFKNDYVTGVDLAVDGGASLL